MGRLYLFVTITLVWFSICVIALRNDADRYQRNSQNQSQYQLALADDQKRVDKHIYDLGYYDGYEKAKMEPEVYDRETGTFSQRKVVSHVPDRELMKMEAKENK